MLQEGTALMLVKVMAYPNQDELPWRWKSNAAYRAFCIRKISYDRGVGGVVEK